MLNDRDAMVDALQAANVLSHHIPALLTKAHEAAQYQGHVFDTFLRRIELRHDGMQVQLSLASLVSVEDGGEDISITRDTPMQIKRRGHEMRLVIEGGMAAAATIDSTLVNAIARAHAWSDALLSGSITSMAEIASRNNVSDSYVKKIMPLAFLAPDIVEAIMAGKQPAHLTTQMLIRQIDIPLDWQEQRRALGFSA
jgi:site-specific DNA recombinase